MPPVADPSLPPWWNAARALADQGKMREAEAAIESAVPHLGCYASLADLWHQRMKQLLAAGDRPAATAAYHRAAMWAFSYAASATSGGEGAALSLERDRILASLRQTFGSDPGPDPDFAKARAALPN